MNARFAKCSLATAVALCAACSSSSSSTTGVSSTTGAVSPTSSATTSSGTGTTSGTATSSSTTGTTSGAPSFYSLAGGAAGVQTLVSNAVTALTSDCVEAPYFTSVLGKPGHHTASDLEACLNLFFSQTAVGGPNTYPGNVITLDGGGYVFNPADGGAVCRDLSTAHNGLGIPPAVFNQFLTDLETVIPAAVTSNTTVANTTVALLTSLEGQVAPSSVDAGIPVEYYFACPGGASFDGGPTAATVDAGVDGGSLFDKYGYASGPADGGLDGGDALGDGGLVFVQAVVGQAIPTLEADCVEAPYFSAVFDGGVVDAGVDSPSDLEGCLEQFFNNAFGGPAYYPAELASGHVCQNMAAAHAGLGIPAPVFNEFVTDLGGVLITDGVTPADVSTVAGELDTYAPQIEADAGAGNPVITDCVCDGTAGYTPAGVCNGLSDGG